MKLLDLLFPPRCGACGELLTPQGKDTPALCHTCAEQLEREKQARERAERQDEENN